MAPRTYALGKRAAQVAQTRERILDAAAVLFREQGIRTTSMQEVARHADVAPATVLNHFPTPELLIEGVLGRVAETLHVPSSRIFQGAYTVEERLRRLVPAMFEFYDRSNQWFAMYQRERNTVQAIRAAEERFWEAIHTLYAEALGPVMMDERMGPAAFGLTNPGTLGALSAAGMSVGQASGLVTDLLLHLLEQQPERGGRI